MNANAAMAPFPLKPQRLALIAGIIILAAILPMMLARAISTPRLPIWRMRAATLTLTPDTDWNQPIPRSAIPEGASLPDAWDKTHPGFGGVGTYRFHVTLTPQALDDRAIYIPRVSNSCRVLVNGVEIASLGSGDRPNWRWNRPLYRIVPQDRLRVGDNDIVIAVSGVKNSRAGLSETYFGPREPLYSAYRLRWFFQVDLLAAANLTAIVLAIPLLFSWIRDPSGSTSYGLFGTASILFGLRNFHGYLDFLPMPVDYWHPLVSASLGWSLAFMYVYLLRLAEVRLPRAERALVVFILAGTVVLFALPTARFIPISPWIWYVPLVVIGLFCIGIFTWRTIVRPSFQRVVLLIGVLAQIGPAIHDVIWIAGYGSFSSILWMALSFPLTLILTSLLLADDMAKTRAKLGNANRVLEARVAEARRDLESLYESRRAAEREAAGAEERLRLMRDMHDGVGTRLSLLLSGLTRREISTGEVENAVRASLEELHLLLDARGPATATLIDAVGNLRYRLGPRLEALGVETRWENGTGAEEISLSAEDTLNVLRILQECITNAVTHGKARVVTLSINRVALADDDSGQGAPSCVIQVRDDGVGLEKATAATKGGGRGIANMKARAAALGGTFELYSTANGTVARLTI